MIKPQKYILGARLTYRDRGLEVLAGPTAMRRAFDADVKVLGEWQDCNAMTVVDAVEHDAAIAVKDAENARVRAAMLKLLDACMGRVKPDIWNAAQAALEENYAPPMETSP